MDYFFYLLYKGFKFVVLALPTKLIRYFLDIVVNIVYLVDIKHKKIAKANLDFVYENTIDEKRKYEIIKNSYKNLVYNLYEFIENPTLDLQKIEQKITVQNEDIILDAIKQDRKIILISSHYGNWEYITSFISLKYKPTTMVGRKLENKYLNDEMEQNRIKHNSEMLPKKGSAKGLVKALKSGRIIGLAIDQHINSKNGVLGYFLKKQTYLIDSTARLAVQTNALIIPVAFIKDDFRRYTVKFENPIDPQDFTGSKDEKISQILQLQFDILTKQIFDKPDDWFWQHRRFKAINNEIYN